MDKFVDIFINWQILLISIAAFAVMTVVRKIGTRKNKEGKVIGGWAEHRYFKMFMPAYPYVLTLALVFIPGVPLPAIVGKTVAVKILFAIWCGFLSDKVYQIVKNFLEKAFNMKFGVDK